MENLDTNDVVDFSQWTSCEFYGHNFQTDEDNPDRRYCSSCGESYTEAS